MERLTFAAIADDDTGASDLAGMLAGQGIAIVLVIDLPPKERLLDWCRGAQAVIMAEGTREVFDRHLTVRVTVARFERSCPSLTCQIRRSSPLNPGSGV
jgi:uncharacterized protein YgbK (DUF1537 family)